MPKGYTTKAEVEKYIGKSLGALDIDSWIEAAEVYIDNYTGRSFVAGNAAERLFDGNDKAKLNIGEAIDIDNVYIGSDHWGSTFEEVSASDYVLLPTGAADNSQPITAIYLKNSYFPRGVQNIKVNGRFGYGANAPAVIKLAATKLTVASVEAYNIDEATRDIKSESIGNYSVTYDTSSKDSGGGGKVYDEVNKMLDPYKRFFI